MLDETSKSWISRLFVEAGDAKKHLWLFLVECFGFNAMLFKFFFFWFHIFLGTCSSIFSTSPYDTTCYFHVIAEYHSRPQKTRINNSLHTADGPLPSFFFFASRDVPPLVKAVPMLERWCQRAMAVGEMQVGPDPVLRLWLWLFVTEQGKILKICLMLNLTWRK